ncbi:uncharacterized protein EI90DRAFT_3018956 [Cantharellus anzutake]|uniref:uncharacterized protein n=1 Tax=Cantharellus anzutake TaxID=1750568 RepID=UPI00190769B2|nr:uncharacterized protein EI90DRAFT_3018956 [Cantharellus anzutake]KAF8325613.1 hypothetical protein EI90DRAFT_3018956 [Cantharellus anzutake]
MHPVDKPGEMRNEQQGEGEGEDEEQVILHVTPEGVVKGRTLWEDYMYRGAEFEEYSLYEFIANTYKEKKAGKQVKCRGDTGNQHVKRGEGHNTVVDIKGAWFPWRTREGENSMYHASMLMMWKPWQGKEDLKQREQTWERAYAEFKESQPGMECIASNVQYRYECKDAADRDQDYARQFGGRQGNEGGNMESDEEDGEDDREEEGGNARIEEQSMDEG